MPGTLKADFLEILRTLSKHGVDFILVGGVAAVVQGAPVMTFDVDVLYATDAQNLTRLLPAIPATRLGPLDLLGSIGNSHTFPKLLPHTVETVVGDGTTIRVLELAMLNRGQRRNRWGQRQSFVTHFAPDARRITPKVNHR